LYAARSTRPVCVMLLHLITRITDGDENRPRNSPLPNILRSPVISSTLGSNVSLGTLLSNTLSLCPSLKVRGLVSL
jgi:hypothetical protein